MSLQLIRLHIVLAIIVVVVVVVVNISKLPSVTLHSNNYTNYNIFI